MRSVVTVLSYAVAAGFAGLAVSAYRRWRAVRDRPRAVLAGALGALALVSIAGRVNDLTDYRFRPLFFVSILAFLLAGYLLLEFRGAFVPLSGWVRLVAALALMAAASVVFYADPPSGPVQEPTAAQTAALLFLVVVWSACVGEPVARFWVASRDRPAVQRARLRALSLAYGGIIVVLFIAVLGRSGTHPAVGLVVQGLALTMMPILYVSFAPPAWLRRLWRAEEEAALRAERDQLLFANSPEEAAERALEWALRVTGASAGVLQAPEGEVLARRGLDEQQAEALVAEVRERDGLLQTRVARQIALVAPVRTEEGRGSLAVLAGPFANLFGQDEADRLAEHAAAAAVALDKIRVAARTVRLEAAKARFISDAAHELRSPLAAIVGIASVFDEGKPELPEEDLEEALRTIARQARRMHLLVNNLLDLTRVEQRDHISVTAGPADLGAAVRTVAELMPPPHGHTLHLDVPEGLVVEADPQRLQQVLVNLLTNSYRYGGSTTTVRARAEDHKVLLLVEDDGPGIPEELVPDLFQPFRRGGNAAAGGGSGLGLALVRSLAESFGGSVAYERAEPTGARFVVELRPAA